MLLIWGGFSGWFLISLIPFRLNITKCRTFSFTASLQMSQWITTFPLDYRCLCVCLGLRMLHKDKLIRRHNPTELRVRSQGEGGVKGGGLALHISHLPPEVFWTLSRDNDDLYVPVHFDSLIPSGHRRRSIKDGLAPLHSADSSIFPPPHPTPSTS